VALQATLAMIAARTLLLLVAHLLQFVTLQATLAMIAARTLPWLVPR
jgi:hypothetical protein